VGSWQRRVTLTLLVVATFAVHAQLPTQTRAARGELFVPRPEVAQATSLGFDAALGDYYWLQAVQIVGGELFPERQGHLLRGLLDVVTTLDPWVDHPYRFAAVWLTDSEESVRKANELLEKGIRYHPDDWRNPFYLGFNHFFYLDEPEAAADALDRAIALPGAPRYLERLAARLRGRTAGLDVAEAFLRELWEGTRDPRARADYEKALDEILTERRARILDAARLVYRKRHGRDIEAVDDLARGPAPVLRALPEEPHGWEWVIAEDGRIVSSYLGHRYEPLIAQGTRERMREWRDGDGPGAAGGGESG
jgi:tetratricopeptide (TPR) repeat protein